MREEKKVSSRISENSKNFSFDQSQKIENVGLNKQNSISAKPEKEGIEKYYVPSFAIVDKTALYNFISDCCLEYESINGVEIEKIKQTQYNDVLMWLSDRCVKPILDIRDGDLLDAIADIYIRLSARFNKSVSIMGYSHLTGIDYDAFMTCARGRVRSELIVDMRTGKVVDNSTIGARNVLNASNDGKRYVTVPNNLYKQVADKIRAARQHSLTDKAEDGSVMSLALGKIEYGWQEGKLAQLQAELLENYALPDDIVSKYQ